MVNFLSIYTSVYFLERRFFIISVHCRRKIWRSGWLSSNVVGVICLPPDPLDSNRVKNLVRGWGGDYTAPCFQRPWCTTSRAVKSKVRKFPSFIHKSNSNHSCWFYWKWKNARFNNPFCQYNQKYVKEKCAYVFLFM